MMLGNIAIVVWTLALVVWMGALLEYVGIWDMLRS